MGIKPPDESLGCYFDELLSEQNSVAPIAVRPNALGPSHVPVPALDKKTQRRIVEHKTWSGPEDRTVPLTATQQKLERLLQAGSTQLLESSIALTENSQSTQLRESVSQSTGFKPDSLEIQDWSIGESTPECFPLVKSADLAPFNPIDKLEWLDNGRPQWAQSRFDVLLLRVTGLTLAVPLVALGQIRPITEKLTPLFGQADWFLGFQITSTTRISTVNTAKFLMPERYDPNFVKTAKYVVSINGVPWGLAVDAVDQPITLNPDAVQWRTNRGKRPWLAGTVKDHMCVLLDIPRIGQLLMSSDKNLSSD